MFADGKIGVAKAIGNPKKNCIREKECFVEGEVILMQKRKGYLGLEAQKIRVAYHRTSVFESMYFILTMSRICII